MGNITIRVPKDRLPNRRITFSKEDYKYVSEEIEEGKAQGWSDWFSKRIAEYRKDHPKTT